MKRLLLFVILSSFFNILQAEDNWPDWRGPTCDGRSDAKDLPLTWSEKENIKWKTTIHDVGWSTPVIWGDQIWLTTASEDGKKLYAVCVDYNTGQIVFDINVFEIENPQRKHPQNSYATPSPVIEQGRVYVHYGTHGTACLDTKSGKVLWRWDEIHCEHVQGSASSLFLFKNLLIVHLEGNDVQYIIALDKVTAKIVWKTERPKEYYVGNPLYYKAYTTPILINVNGTPQLVSNGSKVCVAYDPYTGKEIWRVVYGGDSTISRPIYAEGLVFVNSGYEQPSSQLWAVRPDGRDDVTETHVVWKVTENIPIESSPVYANGCIFTVSDRGIASCLDAKTGSVFWTFDLDEQFGASPLYGNGRIYFFDKKEKSTVVEASSNFKLLAQNILDDGFMASAAVKRNSFILRTKSHLYRVEGSK